MSLEYAERPAGGEADGILFLHHGRGSWEGDLLPVADALDPERKLHAVAPRAPLQIPDAHGYHWYTVPRVGYPDHDTFHAARAALAEFHDDQLERRALPPDRAILAGFSMGAVMSFALGLSADRPAPAGILAFSGFIPTLEDWAPDFASRADLPVFIGHGNQDPVIDVGFAGIAQRKIEAAGLPLEYLEFDGGHWIDPVEIEPAAAWLTRALS